MLCLVLSLSLALPPLPPSPQCYYIGATSDAATKIVNEVSKPLSYHAPVDKICERLKKKDMQICELKYGESSSFQGRVFYTVAPQSSHIGPWPPRIVLHRGI